MNLTSTLVNQRPPRARMMGPAPAAVAILYPKVGNVLRVPLRRTTAYGPGGCEQHPERQFIVWFNRMAAARPGFPRQIRSILLITGQPLCASCHRALASFLSRYYLADKLRLRTTGSACGCGPVLRARADQADAALLLDYLMAESQLEGEDLWSWLRNKVGTGLAIGGLMTNPDPALMPIRDVTTSSAQALAERRKTEALVNDNRRKQPKPSWGGPPPRPNRAPPASNWQTPGSNMNRSFPPVRWKA